MARRITLSIENTSLAEGRPCYVARHAGIERRLSGQSEIAALVRAFEAECEAAAVQLVLEAPDFDPDLIAAWRRAAKARGR
jgi:hypothetical protein